MSTILDSGYGMTMLMQLRDDADHYAKTGECLRCKREVDDDEVRQFLVGVTLYCIVCGKAKVTP